MDILRTNSILNNYGVVNIHKIKENLRMESNKNNSVNRKAQPFVEEKETLIPSDKVVSGY
jgi:hypothetical protein